MEECLGGSPREPSGKAEGYGKAEESVPDLEEEKIFCKVKFVYM